MTTNHASIAAAGEIRSHLARHRITQSSLSAGTGINIHALRRRLTGEVPFTLDELATIASYLSVPASTLMVGAA